MLSGGSVLHAQNRRRLSFMLRQLARTLIVAALVFSIGLHWVVLQSAAWAGMIVTYSIQEGSLLTGMSQTFDAEHPCALCGAVWTGTQKEKKDPRQKKETHKKLLLALVVLERAVLTPPAFVILSTELTQTPFEMDLRPPVPPPRRGAV
jgi:hypothetical protein